MTARSVRQRHPFGTRPVQHLLSFEVLETLHEGKRYSPPQMERTTRLCGTRDLSGLLAARRRWQWHAPLCCLAVIWR